MAKKKKRPKLKNIGPVKFEEGSGLDVIIKQVEEHGASSLLLPDEKTSRYLKRKGFFSPKGTLPKKKVKPSGMKSKAKVMKKGGKVGNSIKTYSSGGYVEGK